MWFGHAILALGFLTLFTLVNKHLLIKKETDAIVYSSVSQFLVAILAAAGILLKGFEFSGTSLTWIGVILVGFSYAAASMLYFTSLKHIGMSQVKILEASKVFWILLGGFLFLNEAITLRKIFAIFFVFLAIVLVSFERKKIFSFSIYSFYMLAAAILFGIGALLDRFLVNHFSVISYQFFNFLLPSIFVFLLKPNKLELLPGFLKNKEIMSKLALNSLAFFAGFNAIFMAYKVGGEASRVDPILEAQTVIIVILGALFFKERTNLLKKFIASLLVVAGVVLIRS